MNIDLVSFQCPSRAALKVALTLNNNVVALQYRIASDLDLTVWPECGSLNRADNLWQATCFELFIANPKDSAYYEINLTPSGAWNCYQFDSERSGMTRSSFAIPKTIVAETPRSLSASLVINESLSREQWLLGVSAIVELASGELDHYAISHGTRPDFHDRSQHVLVSPDNL